MRVVIVGAGTVGSYLAERLSSLGQDVVVVESDDERAIELQNEVDCLVVNGNGTRPQVLRDAGGDRANLLIAVTANDAVNILACHSAERVGIDTRIARIHDRNLKDQARDMGVDVVIDPDEATARQLLLLMQERGVSEVIKYANGQLELVGGFISPQAPIAGMTLAELRTRISGWTWIVVAVIRDGVAEIARGATTILPGDHVVIMAETDTTDEAFRWLGFGHRSARKAIVLGTTRLARFTAGMLADAGIATTVIDNDRERVRKIADALPKVIALHADPVDPKVLLSEGIDRADAILGLTGWDEINTLGCLIGKALGADAAIARVNEFELARILPGVGIDGAVSPRLTAARDILGHVRGEAIQSVVTFSDSEVEAVELLVSSTGSAAGMTLREMGMSRDVIVGAVIRGDEAFVPRGDTTIHAGDRLIAIAQPQAMSELTELSG